MKKLLTIYCICIPIFISGCAGILTKNPTEQQLFGTWESVGVAAYSIIEYKGTNDAVVIVANEIGDYFIYKIENFKSNEYGFEVTFIDVTGNEEPEIVTGTLVGPRLAFGDSENDIVTWYAKKENVQSAKQTAMKALEIYHAQ